MDFHQYFFAMDKPQRSAFASRVGSTEGHLNNVAYGYRQPATDLAVSIERESQGVVGRKELRPDDYWRHWPDLQRGGLEGATARELTGHTYESEPKRLEASHAAA